MALTKVNTTLMSDSAIAAFSSTPVNLLPNTQWQVATGLGTASQMNHEGTGSENAVSVSSYSIGHSGTAQAGASTTITLAAGASSADDFYNGYAVILTGGTGASEPASCSLKAHATQTPCNAVFEIWGSPGDKQIRQITDYVGSTRVATVGVAWGTTPDATTTYKIEGDTTNGYYRDVTFLTSNTQRLKVGDIVDINDVGGSTDAAVTLGFLEVDAVVANTSFTCTCNNGVFPIVSDTCSAVPQMVANIDGSAGGGAADGWATTYDAGTPANSLDCWRDMHSQNRRVGSLYQMGLKKSVATAQTYRCDVASGSDDVEKYKGKDVVFGVWVNHKAKHGSGTWSITVSDGASATESADATATGYTWVEVTHPVSTSAVSLSFRVNVKGSVGDIYYVSQPMAALGTYLGEGNYAQPKQELLIPVVKMSPSTYVGANLDMSAVMSTGGHYGFPFNVYAETHCTIAPTVLGFDMMFEARNFYVDKAFSMSNQEPAPHVYSFNFQSYRSHGMSQGSEFFTLKNGRGFFFAGETGGIATWKGSIRWYNASIDINQIRLSK
jgi:hypothetical protein